MNDSPKKESIAEILGDIANFLSTSPNPKRMKHDEDITDFCDELKAEFFCDKENKMLNPPTQFCDNFDKQLDKLEEMFVSELSLDSPQHCIITNILLDNNEMILTLRNTKTNQETSCIIDGFWRNNEFNIGDTVCICTKQKAGKNWRVNNEIGWIVYEPDLLISCTTVVGSLFCKRRSVLAEKYRGFEPTNRAMVIGTLIHTLLQTVLKEKLRTAREIEEVAKNLVQTSDTIRRLYECDMALKDIQIEIEKFIPKILEFLGEYVHVNSKKRKKDAWQGKICSIDDIEDNIWCTQYGVKGKIDVTIKTEDSSLLPLELKTGRATMSLEHRGQVILYIMMMNRLGYKIPSGLLFYLRENILKEIPTTSQQERDLIILRNELAFYLNKKVSIDKSGFVTPDLPPPIDNFKVCSKCPYSTICGSYLRLKPESEKSPYLERFCDEFTKHLTDEHISYFIKWSNLIRLEENVELGRKNLQEIFTKDPIQRQKEGRCIANVKLIKVAKECNGVIEQIFEKDDADYNMLTFGIVENNYVIVSIDERPAIATGFVTSINSKQISIGLERDLSIKYNNKSFHIDTYDSFNSQSYNLASLSLILEPTPRASELREIIIEKKLPTFLPKLPGVVAKKAVSILKRLNRVQQRAVLKALTAKEYLLIKGMPGTGKTATLVALIELLVALDKTVLLTSHTHAAVDNVCLRLKKVNVDFIRLGSTARIDQELISHSEYNKTKHCTSPEELNEVYNNFKVVAVTCLGSGHPLLTKRTFDLCIVDESTQVLQVSVIRALYSSKSFILVGDPDQLPPVIRSKDAINEGMLETLFERLAYPEATVTLNLNYRMNQTITALANNVTYGGDLEIATEIVRNNSLNIPNLEILESEYGKDSWILKALDLSLDGSIKIIDTGPIWKENEETTEQSDTQSCSNPHEANIVLKLIEALIKGGISGTDIGVIATYRAQVARISSILSNYQIDVSTVDQFQGKDKNIIIYSCTKSKEITDKMDLKSEILNDKRRLTVAITRAKQKFILIGDVSTIVNYSTFDVLLKAVDQRHFIQVKQTNL